jgi:precorrin-6A/cobalt-precorrin-6A reductase
VLTVLILGGSTEASELARALAGDARFAATLSLAGRTRAPLLPPIAVRMGGFGGVAGLADYLRGHGVGALVDATHPFAAVMSRNARLAAAETGTPVLRVDRPAWVAGPGDQWLARPDMAAAAAAIGAAPRRVLLTIGQRDLAAFSEAPQHHYVIRSVDAPDPTCLPPSAEVIPARGPFAEAGELALLAAHRIGVIVTKNSGGSATQAKLVAARALGIPVIMVDRPAAEPGLGVPDAAGALDWLVSHATGTARGA